MQVMVYLVKKQENSFDDVPNCFQVFTTQASIFHDP